ncbi:MAG: hypothetical protein ABS75_14990 [Pelagibacterium sp. SCN 63-23]|nr:MAG: hypothetical protein ABS75_14990 [Pelagibacterium sp. SCN 63-23]
MGLWERLFGAKTAQPAELKRGRGWTFDVVGESQYQEPLVRYYRKHKGDGSNLFVDSVILRTENDNPHDPNAVRVELEGRTVGFLPRAKAIEYRSALADSDALESGATCSAKITGGFQLTEDIKGRDRAHFGIKLNLSWPPRLANT